jgi:hypothetical protein
MWKFRRVPDLVLLSSVASKYSAPFHAKKQGWRSNSASQIAQRNAIRVLNPVERAWLAGVIDGEGSIYISKVIAEYNRRGFVYMLYLSMSNSNYDFVAKVRELERAWLASVIDGEGSVFLSKVVNRAYRRDSTTFRSSRYPIATETS